MVVLASAVTAPELGLPAGEVGQEISPTLQKLLVHQHNRSNLSEAFDGQWNGLD